MILASIFIGLLLFSPIPATEGKVIEYVVENENLEHVAISPDGAYVAAAVDYRNVYLLDSNRDLIWEKSFKSWVNAISISADHVILIAISDEISLFNIKGDLVWKRGFTEIGDAAISSDGSYVVATVDYSSYNYSIPSQPPSTPTPPADYSPNNYTVLILDRTGNEAASYYIGDDGKIDVSSHGEYIAIGTQDRNLHLIDGKGRLIWKNKLPSSMSSGISSVSISPEGDFIAVSAYSMILYARNGTLLWEGDSETWGTRAASISSKGEYIVASGSDINLFNQSGKKVWSYSIPEGKSLEDVDISSDGSLISAVARSFVVPGFGGIYVLDNPPGTELIRKPSVEPSRIDIYTDPNYLLIGRSVSVNGVLDPPVPSAEITLIYRKPDGEVFSKKISTDIDGSFSDVVSTDQVGSWTVNATFGGGGDIKPSEHSSGFLVEPVEERAETQSYQPVSRVTMEVGERRSFKTVKSGNMFYKYKVVDCPASIVYYGSYTEFLMGGDDYIESTIKVMPYTNPGVYQVRADYGWSGSPIVMGDFTYTYQLTFEIEVVPRDEKYDTSLILSMEGREDTFNATGAAYIAVNGFSVPCPNCNITLTYIKPDGKEVVNTLSTRKDGTFLDRLKTDVSGTWKAKATWSGDSAKNGASSDVIAFNAEAPSMLPIVYIAAPIAAVLVLLVVLIRIRKR